MGRLRVLNKGIPAAQPPRGQLGEMQAPDKSGAGAADAAAGAKAPEQPPPAQPATHSSAATPSPPSHSAAQSADADFLRRLAPEVFRVLAREECRRHNVKSMDEAAQIPALAPLAIEIIRRGDIGLIFPLGAAPKPPRPAPAPPPQRPSARPPPSPRQSTPSPPSRPAEDDGGPVSGYEATMAPHAPGAPPLPPPPKKPSVRPPPPPRRAAPQPAAQQPPQAEVRFFSDLSPRFRKLVDDIDRDVHNNTLDGTNKRLEYADTYFNIGSTMMRGALKELMGNHPPDELMRIQNAASQKLARLQKGEKLELEPLEARLLDINTINGVLGKLQDIIQFLRTAAGKESELRRIKATNGQRPAEAEAQSPEDRQRISKPSPPPKPQKGLLSRFLSNYWMPTSLAITAFTAALVYNERFRSMAAGVKMLWERATGRQISDIPVGWVMGVYAGLMVSLVVLTEAVRRIIARRRAAKDFANAQLSKSDEEKSRYITDALKGLVSEHQKLSAEQRKLKNLGQTITEALRSDDLLFEYVYDLRKEAIFKYVLEDARVPDKLHGPVFDELLMAVERERMQAELIDLADLAGDEKAGERREKFREMLTGNKIFRKICDSLFARDAAGGYLDAGRAERIFRPLKSRRKEMVGEALLAGLRSDYDEVTKRK